MDSAFRRSWVVHNFVIISRVMQFRGHRMLTFKIINILIVPAKRTNLVKH